MTAKRNISHLLVALFAFLDITLKTNAVSYEVNQRSTTKKWQAYSCNCWLFLGILEISLRLTHEKIWCNILTINVF
jgi:hypothetical protein